MRDFEVHTSQSSDELVVTPVGELDIATVDRLAVALEGRRPSEGVCIDLSRLDFLDTSGIQLLVEVQRDARAGDYPLRIVRANARVHRVFEIAGLDRVLPFVDADG